MTSIDEHKKIVKELTDDLNEKIRARIIVQRQKIIGFAASEASTNLFAILLHKSNLITPGFNVNHKFFSSIRTAENSFKFDFSRKTEMIELMVEQERYRDLLCYGKDKNTEVVEGCIRNYFKLKSLLESMTGEPI